MKTYKGLALRMVLMFSIGVLVITYLTGWFNDPIVRTIFNLVACVTWGHIVGQTAADSIDKIREDQAHATDQDHNT